MADREEAETLSPARVLDAAEEVLRRYGPSKTNVVDVARALGVSHGNVYRYFPSKAALRDAVASRWLSRVSSPLWEIAQGRGSAEDRLRQWLHQLSRVKRDKVLQDPELFATYHSIAEQSSGAVDAHVRELKQQLARIILDGQESRSFKVSDPEHAASAVFDATMRFHHPAHSKEWKDPDIDDALDVVIDLLIAGMKP